MTPNATDLDEASSGPRQRELQLFFLYRLFEAFLLAFLVFSPVGGLLGGVHSPKLAATVSVAYLVFAVAMQVRVQHWDIDLARHVLAAISVDILVAVLASHAVPNARAGIALLLLFNIAGASLFLRPRVSFLIAGLAAVALMGEYLWAIIETGASQRSLAEVLMFAIGFCGATALTYQVGRQMRASLALANRRGAEAANLAEINDLIIRRMRTGVLLVDARGRIRLANEAAMSLLDSDDTLPPSDVHGQPLVEVAPELHERLQAWLRDGRLLDAPLTCGPERIEVTPRFVRLLANSDSVLVFLDDTSLLSRRAESITLAAMGRFSASLAHEIRNPLAAINYAAQLLEESPDLSVSDRRLLQIIHQQCMRTNGIVESVLSLARRERAQPQHIDLVPFVDNFVEEYRLITSEDNAQVKRTGDIATLMGAFDPRHLQQVLTVLVNNAVRYGRMPGEPARIAIHLEQGEDGPAISVLDRGPGIPDAVAPQLFRPFFTTSDTGTGLGLYIASELCKANDARLEYVPVPAGGACFRIHIPARPLFPGDPAL